MPRVELPRGRVAVGGVGRQRDGREGSVASAVVNATAAAARRRRACGQSKAGSGRGRRTGGAHASPSCLVVESRDRRAAGCESVQRRDQDHSYPRRADLHKRDGKEVESAHPVDGPARAGGCRPRTVSSRASEADAGRAPRVPAGQPPRRRRTAPSPPAPMRSARRPPRRRARAAGPVSGASTAPARRCRCSQIWTRVPAVDVPLGTSELPARLRVAVGPVRLRDHTCAPVLLQSQRRTLVPAMPRAMSRRCPAAQGAARLDRRPLLRDGAVADPDLDRCCRWCPLGVVVQAHAVGVDEGARGHRAPPPPPPPVPPPVNRLRTKTRGAQVAVVPAGDSNAPTSSNANARAPPSAIAAWIAFAY